jgi:hypothetical protein
MNDSADRDVLPDERPAELSPAKNDFARLVGRLLAAEWRALHPAGGAAVKKATAAPPRRRTPAQ